MEAYEPYVARPEHEYFIFDRLEDSFSQIGKFTTIDKKLIVDQPIWLDDYQILLQVLFNLYSSRDKERLVQGFDHCFLIVRSDIICNVPVEGQPDPCQSINKSPNELLGSWSTTCAEDADVSGIEPFTPLISKRE